MSRKISQWFSEPGNLVITFIAAMIVPNVVLAFTEPYGFTTICTLILLPAGVYLLWCMATARPGVMILWAIPIMILCAFQLVISYLFGNSIIAVDMFLNVFTTSVSEASELLGTIYPSVILVILIYIPLIVLAARSVRKKKKLTPRNRRCGTLAAICLIAAGTGFAGLSKMRNAEFAVKKHIFPNNIFYNMKLAAQKWNRQALYPQTSSGFSFGAEKTRRDSASREIYVYVIGEASRGYSWQLLGYERETTPRLSARGDIVVFRDVLTQSNTTHKSVPMMLTHESAAGNDSIYHYKSIVTLFKEAGFRTAFISNQPPNRTLTDYFAGEADTVINITDGLMGAQHYDDELIEPLREVIGGTQEDLLVVVHTYGSHTRHYKRYPREFAHFQPDHTPSAKPSVKEEMRNAYDNTIVYTDHVLTEMISALEATGASSALLFSPDHGEDIFDDRRNKYLHSSPRATYYQLHIPVIAWFSPAYRASFADKVSAAEANTSAPVTTAALFHTLADMASVESQYADPRNSLVSANREDMPRLYLDDHDKAINVVNSGLDREDFIMFDRHSIKYDPKDIIKKRY